MLRGKGSEMKKIEIVRHFDGQYDKSAVYRELKKLVESGQVAEAAGSFSVAKVKDADGAN